ncbi:MAG: hypothetical protein H6757_00085 [Candidatus Omnitrophica bacterium]|nr:hypothetical protein [Candidatus Omnitrophota bacterium]
MKKMALFTLILNLYFLFSANAVFACAVCFGDPGSDQTKAVMWGVLLLLGVIGFVLGGIIVTIFSCVKRAKKLYPSPLAHEA